MKKRHANEFLRTSTGRLAGSGILYDNYDDEATLDNHRRESNTVHSKEYVEFWEELKKEQPVTVYKLSKTEMEEYIENLNRR